MDQTITVKNRNETGSSFVRRLRREGRIPGVIYGSGASRSVSLPKHEFEQMLHGHSGEHVMIPIRLDDGNEESVLLKEVQHNPLTGDVIHVDMQEVAMNEKLSIEVPVRLVGEAEGVKQGGLLDHLLHELEIECLPSDIPEEIRVDVSSLQIGDILMVSDIFAGNEKIRILSDPEAGVASVSPPKTMEEPAAESEEEETEESGEPEVIREKKAEEESE